MRKRQDGGLTSRCGAQSGVCARLLRHRGRLAQMGNQLYSSMDKKIGSGHGPLLNNHPITRPHFRVEAKRHLDRRRAALVTLSFRDS
jgi:hypothetical protein